MHTAAPFGPPVSSRHECLNVATICGLGVFKSLLVNAALGVCFQIIKVSEQAKYDALQLSQAASLQPLPKCIFPKIKIAEHVLQMTSRWQLTHALHTCSISLLVLRFCSSVAVAWFATGAGTSMSMSYESACVGLEPDTLQNAALSALQPPFTQAQQHLS